MRFAFAPVLAFAALFAAPALAQEAPLSKVYACADIKDSAQRLACFDGAVATLKQADAGGDVAVVSRSQVQKVEKDAFGLSVPSVNELAASVGPAPSAAATPAAAKPPKPEKVKPLDRVTLAVRSIQKDGQGGMTFVMENGQVWKKIDTTSMLGMGKGPWTAEIKRAALGSYVLSLGGTSSARVKRIE
jgi:hypothetical protein